MTKFVAALMMMAVGVAAQDKAVVRFYGESL